jgi:uncharacterized protein
MRDRSVRRGARRLWWWASLCLITACVLVACGNSHPASTATAAGPTFPNTPAGVQARWVLQAVNRQPISNAEVRAHFGQAFLAHATPAQLAEILNEKLIGYARVRLVSITTSQPKTLVFVMSVRGAQRFEMRLSVDTQGLIADLQTLREIPPTTSATSVIPPLATGWVAQPVTFQAGGVTIYGTYTHPRHARAQTLAAAVLLGGSGTATDRNDNGTLTASNGLSVWQGNRDTLETVANWLSADGVASLRYDKLGSSRTGWGRYAGHTEQVGLRVYEQEAVAALSFLARQPQVSPSRLAAVGHSEGGIYALLLATGHAHAPRLQDVILLEPVPVRMLSLFLPAPGAASPSVRESLERAVASLRRTGRLPSGLPASVANSFNARDYGTPLELSQIDRYDPATLAAKIPFNTAVLLTCSNADPGITCAMEKRIADGVTNAAAKLVRVQLDGVDHILKEDLTRDPATWNQALPFSTQLRSALRNFVANSF